MRVERKGGRKEGAKVESARGMVYTEPPADCIDSSMCGKEVQRFRVRHGLSCVFGPLWPVGAGCYSQAALPMPLSKPL